MYGQGQQPHPQGQPQQPPQYGYGYPQQPPAPQTPQAPQPGYGFPQQQPPAFGQPQQPPQAFGPPPAFGQPEQQPPAYGQPPAFGQPQQPPGYGFPQQQPGYGFQPQQPPKQPASGAKTALIVVGVMVLLGVGGGVIAAINHFNQAPVAVGGTNKVVLPPTFEGAPQDPGNPIAQKMQSQLQEMFGPGHDKFTWTPKPVSAMYLDKSAKKVVLTYGGWGDVVEPSHEVDSFFNSAETSGKPQGISFGARQDFNAQGLGGRLSCEEVRTPQETDSLCVWGDYSSVMAVMSGTAGFTGHADLEKASNEATTLRRAAEVPK